MATRPHGFTPFIETITGTDVFSWKKNEQPPPPPPPPPTHTHTHTHTHTPKKKQKNKQTKKQRNKGGWYTFQFLEVGHFIGPDTTPVLALNQNGFCWHFVDKSFKGFHTCFIQIWTWILKLGPTSSSSSNETQGNPDDRQIWRGALVGLSQDDVWVFSRLSTPRAGFSKSVSLQGYGIP